MLNEERKTLILDILSREGRVVVRDLTDRLSTSEVTIRKDLESLHASGLLHRTHGGAVPAPAMMAVGQSLQEKEKQHQAEKQRIAAAALNMIREGQTIILDGGTTTTALARHLRDFRKLTVITNAVNIAAELAGTQLQVIVPGGLLHEQLLVGPQTEEALRRFNADILFLGVDGFDVRYGLTTPNLLEAQVNRVMVEVARRTVAVCDSSKFGRRTLSLIVPPSAIHELITDTGISQADQDTLRQAGVQVTLV